MVRFPKRVVTVVIILIILLNVWYLSQKHFPKDFSKTSQEVAPAKHSGGPGNHQNVYSGDSKESSDNKKGSGGPPKGLESTETAPFKVAIAVIKENLKKLAAISPEVELGDYFREIVPDSSLIDNNELPPTSAVMGLYLQISNEDVNTLKETHEKVMKTVITSVPQGSFTGRGIVMTGGGKYFPMVLTAIRWLKRHEPNTPIEVFLRDHSEYEPEICEKLLPSLNAECRIIKDIYGDALGEVESVYALKPLAILASKFDDIYFMDADSYPLTKLDEIFDWKVYKETGMILNADYWPRYISPKYYDIVGIELGGRARGNKEDSVLLQSDRENAVPGKSTESGQVFLRKSSHLQSLLLATYYNLHGADVFFQLLMQRGHGEGDKDTYAAAAIVCGETYYQTQRRPVTLGQKFNLGGFKGYAMVQPNPIVDYRKHEENSKEKDAFFALHANSIKANPKYLLEGRVEQHRGSPPLRKQRFFGTMSYMRDELLEDTDYELEFFNDMKYVACEWAVKDGHVPNDWKDSDIKRFCNILTKHTAWLKENPDVGAPSDADFWIDLM